MTVYTTNGGYRPDAIASVIDALRASTQPGANPIRLERALLILLYITKELATGRLMRSRQSLQTATPEIVHILGRIYLDKVQTWQAGIAGAADQRDLLKAMEHSLMAIRVLRRLFIVGYAFPNRDTDVHEFWQLSFAQVRSFLEIVNGPSGSNLPFVIDMVEKHLLKLSKLHLEMAQTHPAAFVLLPNSVDLVRAYWGLLRQFGSSYGAPEGALATADGMYTRAAQTDEDGSEGPQFLEKMSLRGLLLIRACVKMVFNPAQTFKYRHAQEKEEKARATKAMQDELLTQSFVQELMEVIVTKFFVFREIDLREWEEEPQEWERKEEAESEGFEFSVRLCAEKLFLDLTLNFKELIIPPLLQVFYSVASVDNENILFKESVYAAIGLSAPMIHQHLDFNAFLSSTLVAEVQKQTPRYNILRRRIAILLSQWITIQVSDENRPLVYQIFQHMLNPDDPLNDEVVRITAGRQFKNIADAWEFDAKQFLPYADSILTRLMQLIGEAELTETKMALLNTISVIVERLEHHITPYAESIITLLPPLWEQSGEEHLMKQAILTILARLVNAMKAASVPFHALVLPIIKGAVEPGSDTEVYLLEDALDLWSSILVQTPAPASTDLLSLAPYLFAIFDLGSENLRKALEIAQSYMLLAPTEMLSDGIRKPLLASLANLLGSHLNPEANGLVHNLVETILRAAESVAGEQAVAQVTADLVASEFLGKQLEGLHGSWRAHCTTGPLAADPPVDGIVETDYFSVLARIILGSAPAFLQAVSTAAPHTVTGTRPSLDETMKWLLEEWCSHFENIGDPSRRKLMCLALTKLLDQQFMLLHLQSLMSLWTDVITELREDAADVDGDSLVAADSSWQGTREEGVPEAPEEGRLRALTKSDPVHAVQTPVWVRHYLHAAIEACGGQTAFQEQWLVNVDRDVVAAFGSLGIM